MTSGKYSSVGILSVFLATAAAAQDPMVTPQMAAALAEPIDALQGEWVTRFCSKSYKWRITGTTVTMAAKGTLPGDDVYQNRYPVGATIMRLGPVFDKTERMVRWTVTKVEPDGSESTGGKAALTVYRDSVSYLSFNEMIRAADKKRQCT